MAGDTTIRFGKAKIQLTGFTDLFRKLDRLGFDMLEVADDVFKNGQRKVLAKALSAVPERLGHLKASGRASKPRINKRTKVITASVNFGGKQLQEKTGRSEIYPIVIHEDPTHAGYKFLEKSMLAEKAAAMAALEARVARKVERG